jgi:steroid 5-alpha reductase family enzyme
MCLIHSTIIKNAALAQGLTFTGTKSRHVIFFTVLILMWDLRLLLHLWKTQLKNGWSKDLSTFDNEQSEHLR